MSSSDNQFSAGEQALGYLYQIRYALLQTLRLPEDNVCFIEKDDDIDFTDPEKGRILASLKHKAPGDSLTDLSPDFWKSVRIWLNYYINNIFRFMIINPEYPPVNAQVIFNRALIPTYSRLRKGRPRHLSVHPRPSA